MLTPTLNGPSDLFLKLQRESYRTFHSTNPIHTADHLYNFCITALAVRDWYFVSMGWSNNKKEEFNNQLYNDPLLAACADIANSSKHCELRGGERLHHAKLSTTEVVDIYEDKDSKLHTVHRNDHPDISVTLSSGEIVSAHELTGQVIKFWRDFFEKQEIEVPNQDFGTLADLEP